MPVTSPIGTGERLVHEIEVAALNCCVRGALEIYRDAPADIGFAIPVHLIEKIEETLPFRFREPPRAQACRRDYGGRSAGDKQR